MHSNVVWQIVGLYAVSTIPEKHTIPIAVVYVVCMIPDSKVTPCLIPLSYLLTNLIKCLVLSFRS